MNRFSNVKLFISILLLICFVFPRFIASANLNGSNGNYLILGDTFDSGGGTSSSTTYDALTTIGPAFTGLTDSTNYRAEFGYNNEIQTAVPRQPVFTNDGNYYNKLKFKINSIDASNNKTDTKYAIAITSAANWSDPTKIKFVQDTYAIGSTLGIEDYMTYSVLGGSSGILVTGLDPDVLYRARVSALQGDFTGSDWGVEASAATVVPFVNMNVDITETNFGPLSISAVSTSSPNTNVVINTNVDSGYSLKVASQGDGSNDGLYNNTGVGYLITSLTAILVAGTEGYGIQGSSSTATIPASYNKTGNDVGGLSRTAQLLASNSNSVVNEQVTVTSKSSISSLTPGGNYIDTLIFTVQTGL